MKKFTRNPDSKILAGVCSGFAEFLGIDVTVVRIIWIVFTLFGGSGILAYILGVLLIPEGEKIVSEKSGDPIIHENKTGWYLVLIAVAVFTLIQYDDVIGVLWNAFWGSGFNVFAAVLLIVSGIFLLSKRKEKEAEKETPLPNQLHISQKNKKILGVCGGIGETFDLDINFVRYLWVLGTFMSAGIGIIAYLVLGIMLPKNEDTVVNNEDH